MKNQISQLILKISINLFFLSTVLQLNAQTTPDNLTSISFDMRKGGTVCTNPSSVGFDTPTPIGAPNNSAGLVLPGQVGLWNSLNSGSGFLTVCCPNSPSISVNGITFNLNTNADTYESFAGGTPITDSLRQPVIFLRNNLCIDENNAIGGSISSEISWQITGLDTAKVYKLILFGQAGGNPADFSITGHDAGNGVGNAVTLDSEFDGNFHNVSPNANGQIEGAFKKRPNEQFSSWAGLQILEGYTSDCGDMTDYIIHDSYINHQYNQFNTNGTIETTGTVNVTGNDGTTNFVSGSSVTLKPGFHAKTNSNFQATIGSCMNASSQDPIATSRHDNPLAQAIVEQEISLTPQTLEVNPNPVLYDAKIAFELPKDTPISIGLFNMSGQQLRTLKEGNFTQGNHEFMVSVQDLSVGMYYIQLQSNQGNTVQKIMIME